MKRYIAGLLTGIIVCNGVWAAESQWAQIYFNQVKVFANNRLVIDDNIMYNNKTYVPLRAVANLLDCRIQWYQDSRTIFIDNNFKFTDTKINIDGKDTNYKNVVHWIADENGNIDAKNSTIYIEQDMAYPYLYAIKYDKENDILYYNSYYPNINSNSDANSNSSVIESNIDGEFEGFDEGKIFKLINGQIWQQTEYYYYYHYAYSPKVIIFNSDGVYKMKVDGIDKEVSVKQLK